MGHNPRFSKTLAEVSDLLNRDPFGITVFARNVVTDDDAFSFSVHSKLINLDPPTCDCGKVKSLSVIAKNAGSDDQGLKWICRGAPRCRKESYILQNTWFTGSKIPIMKVLEVTTYWFFQVPVSDAAGQLGISKQCAIDWYTYCRQVCFAVIHDMQIAIGGPGLTVELDESHLWRNKYRVGRIMAHQDKWIFAGICRETREAFVMTVPDRSGATLWPIIAQRVVPGTVIYTDSARVYDNLHAPARGGFEHYQVNHSQNFVHPQNRSCHTNNIENFWRWIKKSIKGFTENDETIELYLAEFIYRRQFLKTDSDAEKRTRGKQLQTFLGHISEVFPGPLRIGLEMP